MTQFAQHHLARLTALLVVAGVLLACWFVRIHNLLLFPPFLDEADHISWASDLYTLHPFTGATNGKLLGLWWMAAFGLYGDGALWIARGATALFSVLGVAAVYSLGRSFASPGIGMVSALAYSVSPYAFFFDRMALVDSYVAVLGALAAWFAVRFTRSARNVDALLCGFALTGAVLAKATGVMLAVLPGLAISLLTPGWSWRERLRGLAWSYGALAAVWVPLYLVLLWRGYGYFATATTVVGTGEMAGVLDRLGDNFRGLWQIDITYLGLPFLLVAVLMSGYLLLRRARVGLFLALVTLLPLAGLLAFATKLSTRYLQFHIPFLVMLAAIGIGLLAGELNRKLRLPQLAIPLALFAVWVGTTAAPFIARFWGDPLEVRLTSADRIEYVTADSAGFALPEAAAFLQDMADSQPTWVIGLLPNCRGLDLLISERIPLTVECPYILLDGSKQPMIAARVDELAAQAGEGFDLWVALDNAVPYVSLEGITAPLESAAVFERPDGRTYITLYRLTQGSARS